MCATINNMLEMFLGEKSPCTEIPKNLVWFMYEYINVSYFSDVFLISECLGKVVP